MLLSLSRSGPSASCELFLCSPCELSIEPIGNTKAAQLKQLVSAVFTKMHLLALVWLAACCMAQRAHAETALIVNATAIQRSGEWLQVLPSTPQARPSISSECKLRQLGANSSIAVNPHICI